MLDIEVLYFVMICGADLLGVFWYFDYDKSFSCIITIYHHVYYLFLLLFLCQICLFLEITLTYLCTLSANHVQGL